MLQAAYAQLLCWLTGQHDVVFGTTVSGRPADLVGRTQWWAFSSTRCRCGRA
ncbi:condensation domain protein [Mycobacterium xenopi 4042]|uniref:Condensation domain protein n=1 Tax=Mycobacterium xenopi 4042 TaxID=1299334 RepID=X8ANL3_MYCXE|nr:condensation domain protein [Mycobacterium xenopi 4042]